jgi:hypothetical protein
VLAAAGAVALPATLACLHARRHRSNTLPKEATNMHKPSRTAARRTLTTRPAKRAAVGALAALVLAAGTGVAPTEAEAMGPGDGFHYCLKAGGNYMECWYWWNFLT